FPGIDNPWLAFFGPKGMPQDYVERLDQAVKTVLQQPDLQQYLAKLGNEVAPVPGSEVQQWVASANKRWSQVIRESGFKPQ
ncbi:MAG: hypothetical protein JWP52_4167, partial [Rhizobacter sp.]|nr:hypothetical protein [Rhizobacter sp.]